MDNTDQIQTGNGFNGMVNKAAKGGSKVALEVQKTGIKASGARSEVRKQILSDIKSETTSSQTGDSNISSLSAMRDRKVAAANAPDDLFYRALAKGDATKALDISIAGAEASLKSSRRARKEMEWGRQNIQNQAQKALDEFPLL